MKIRRLILLTLMLSLVSVVSAYAADWNQGTWKLNEAKSKIPAGAQKNTSVTYSMAGDSVKAVVEGVDGSGKATHDEWTGKYDGKDYPVTGAATSDSRSLKKISDRKYKLVTKKGGKIVATGSIEFSADGKTRTVTTTATDEKGKKTTTVGVYDKQ